MPKKPKNHYETLGIEPDATAEEVKRAYVNRAHQTHPDKNPDKVDGAEFAAVSEAYTILSDFGKRQLYDATGRDNQTPIELQVRSELLKAFSAAISMPNNENGIVVTVRNAFKRAIESIAAERERQESALPELLAKRDRVKTAGEVNLVHLLIDEEIGRNERHRSELDHQNEVMHACLEALEEYSETVKPVKPKVVEYPAFGSLADMMRIPSDPWGGGKW